MKQTSFILTVTTALCAILCGGCAHRDALEDALGQAGSNRSELETVLDHYKNDSLKYEAAVLLIKNMPYRYSLVGEERSNLDRFYIAASESESLPQSVNDSLKAIGVNFNTSKLRVSKDIQSVSSAFLIDHIDKAFEIWRKQPWGKNVDFDTFLRHILPYRVGNEPLRPWIGELHERFDPLLNSIRQTPDSADIVKVTEALVDTLRKMKRHYGHGLPSGVSIGPDNTRWLAGDCREFTDIQTYIMRSVGLPGGCDKMPISGNYFLPHFWNYVINGKDEHSLVNPEILASQIYISLRDKLESQNHITYAEEKSVYKSLEELIESISEGFFYRLNILTEGMITDSERKMAMLIKCGFSPLQISVLLGREKNTISTHRRNLAFKISGLKKADYSLDLIIISL